MNEQLEHFVKDVGGCGLFQLCLALSVYSVKMLGTWGMMLMVFGGFNPGYSCGDGPGSSQENDFNRTSNGTKANLTSKWNSSTAEDVSCDAIDTCGHIVFSPEASTILTEFGLICDRSWIIPFIISIQMVGVGVGCSCCGLVGDNFGRKTNMYSWVALSAAANVVAVFSETWQMFAVVRFFIGLSIGGVLVSGQSYALEFVTGKWRAILAGLPVWSVASVLFGLCFWYLKDWRQVHIATAVFSGLIFLTVFWVPESMRWLAVHGKHDIAEAVARKICKYNGRQFQYEEEGCFMIKDSGQTDNAKGDNELTVTRKPSICHLFQPPLRKNMILCTSLFFINSVMYYTISFGITALFGNFYVNFIVLSIMSPPFAPLVPICGNKFGRRCTTLAFFTSAGLMSCCVVIVYFTTSGDVRAVAITLLASLILAFVDQAWNLQVVYLSELFPTLVRVQSFGVANTSARLGGILAPYLVPRDSSRLYVCYIIMSCLAVIAFLLVFCLPETKGRGLQDTIRLKKQAVQDEDHATKPNTS